MTSAIRDAIRVQALAMGFDAVGFAEARLAEGARADLAEYIDRGYHGDMGWLALTLLAGTPALTFIGLVGAALAVGLRRGGLLLAILVLPLTVPVLIFGVTAANAAIIGPTPFGPSLVILCALSLASLVLGPIAAAAALRHGLE